MANNLKLMYDDGQSLWEANRERPPVFVTYIDNATLTKVSTTSKGSGSTTVDQELKFIAKPAGFYRIQAQLAFSGSVASGMSLTISGDTAPVFNGGYWVMSGSSFYTTGGTGLGITGSSTLNIVSVFGYLTIPSDNTLEYTMGVYWAKDAGAGSLSLMPGSYLFFDLIT